MTEENAQIAQEIMNSLHHVAGKPRIPADCSTDLEIRTDRALRAIDVVYNDPTPLVFVRDGKLSRVINDEKGVPKIDVLGKESLTAILQRCITWYERKEIKDAAVMGGKRSIDVTVNPPFAVVNDIFGIGRWNLPPLEGIVESPYISTNGYIIAEPGYDCQTRLVFSPQPGYEEIIVQSQPTAEEVTAAKQFLYDLFSEFQFEDESSRENNLACLITATIRPLIDDVTPMAVYDKPMMGCGAGLLGDIIAIIATGRTAAMAHAPGRNNPEEWDKVIMSLLREGRTLIIFDNCEGDIYNSALASVLTSRRYRGRLLAKNETAEYLNNATWVANGNNIQITHDLPRRCYWIRLTSEVARPYEWTGWKIPDIRRHVMDHRYEYLTAILTIVKAWHVAGKPKPDDSLQIMGGFEKWRDTIGGIMKFIGCTEFLKNTTTNLEIAEETFGDIEIFLQEIYNAFPLVKDTSTTRYFTVKEIEPVADPYNYKPGTGGVPIEKMPGYLQQIQSDQPKKLSNAIGQLFKHNHGRVFSNGFKLEKGKPLHSILTYRIVRKVVQVKP